MRVQEHTLESGLTQCGVGGRITVLHITRDRVTTIGRMHTNLVSTPGLERRFDQRGARPKLLDQFELGARTLATLADPHGALAADPRIGLERCANQLTTELQRPTTNAR